MNQLEGLTILVDTARQMPETKHLRRARRWADHRIEVLRERKRKRDAQRNGNIDPGTLAAWNEVVRDKFISGVPAHCCKCLISVHRRA